MCLVRLLKETEESLNITYDISALVHMLYNKYIATK